MERMAITVNRPKASVLASQTLAVISAKNVRQATMAIQSASHATVNFSAL